MTFQTKLIFRAIGVELVIMSAAGELESEKAGKITFTKFGEFISISKLSNLYGAFYSSFIQIIIYCHINLLMTMRRMSSADCLMLYLNMESKILTCMLQV